MKIITSISIKFHDMVILKPILVTLTGGKQSGEVSPLNTTLNTVLCN